MIEKLKIWVSESWKSAQALRYCTWLYLFLWLQLITWTRGQPMCLLPQASNNQ